MTPHPNRASAARACALTLALALCGCGGADEDGSRNAAEGEILPGSASDAMIALDQVRSQAPLAQRAGTSGRPGEPGGIPSGEPAPDATATNAPAAPAPDAPAAPTPAAE